MSLLAVILTLLAAGCGGVDDTLSPSGGSMKIESYERGNYRLELSYPADDINYGSTAEIVLRIEYPENEKYILMPPVVDRGGRYSNTVISGVFESEPVLSGTGTAVSTISFKVEAWLPGEIVFPPLTVNFAEQLSTDEIIITAGSAFEVEEEAHELSPLYLPEADNMSHPGLIAAVVSAVVLIAAVLVIILTLRWRKKSSVTAEPVKTRIELIADFRKKFIETEGIVDLREAFSALLRIPGAADCSQYRPFMDEARFSKNGISVEDGLIILRQIYQQLNTEGGDEL
ncbi:MAG: hypothetical protein JEZ04_12790 [Spirochaetales bacterium]|nr:hypothetical protein [Spirochaetales bacterium]